METNVFIPTKAELSRDYVNYYKSLFNSIVRELDEAIEAGKVRKAERLLEKAQRYDRHLNFITG